MFYCKPEQEKAGMFGLNVGFPGQWRRFSPHRETSPEKLMGEWDDGIIIRDPCLRSHADNARAFPGPIHYGFIPVV